MEHSFLRQGGMAVEPLHATLRHASPSNETLQADQGHPRDLHRHLDHHPGAGIERALNEAPRRRPGP